MKYIRILAIGLILFLASSCAVDYLEFPSEEVNGSDEITVIGHITRFDDYEVATRSAKNEDEVHITSFAMAIFRVNEVAAVADSCVHYEYHENATQLLFTVDRSNSKYETGQEYAIYVFANIPNMKTYDPDEGYDITKLSLETLLSESIEVENLNIPKNGFPMLGSLGDTFSTIIDKDGKTFVMSPTIGDEPPTVNGEAASTLNIPIKALYAKINFEIEVRPDQTIQDSFAPQFTLKNYKIVNVPNSLDFKNSTNADTDDAIGVLDPITVDAGNPVASGSNTIKFSFYLPENLLVSDKDTASFEYPFKGSYDKTIDKDEDGIRNEDEKYCQRYKGKLLGENQKATHIVLKGEFRDHQNHSVNVDYTIHLGKDNFSDFNIVRNCEYSNYITIKGILNSSDNKDNYISLDHRVNVEHTQPSIVSLRREVLLDSHYEIRPIRIKKSNYAGDNLPNAMKVEVLSPSITTWMRVERSFGDGNEDGQYPSNAATDGVPIYITADDCTDGNYAPKGKRRYFTHNLITGANAGTYDYPLNNSTQAIVPLDENGECVWLYVDECTEVGDGTRSGVIRMTYGNLKNDGTFTEVNSEEFPQVNYAIIQRKLFNVSNSGSGKTYHIEYEEEYLHNFDSEDIFGETQEEGMEWGLYGTTLSFDHDALFFESYLGWDIIDYIINIVKGNTPAYYDYYIRSHDAEKLNQTLATIHDHAGWDFCDEIIKQVNGTVPNQSAANKDTNPDNDITILPLNKQPKSAIEYCYNKNKRLANGNVISDYRWYLPAIDEMEEIVMSTYTSENGTYYTYSRFLDFQNKYYWSCQPAYLPNYAYYRSSLRIDYYGDYYRDDDGKYAAGTAEAQSDRNNIGSARATKVLYENGGYKSSPSGTDGYYSFYNANTKVTTYEGTENNKEIGSITREDGNKARNDMARVRCVRKQ